MEQNVIFPCSSFRAEICTACLWCLTHYTRNFSNFELRCHVFWCRYSKLHLIWKVSSDSSCFRTASKCLYTLLFNVLLCSFSNSAIKANKSIHLCLHFLLIYDPKDINLFRTTTFIASHVTECDAVSGMLKSKKFFISVSIPSLTSLLESSAVFSLQDWGLSSRSCTVCEQDTQAWSLHNL